jgi:hypothetical protein
MIEDGEWEFFQSYGELGPAEVLKGQLVSGGVPARVQALTLDVGIDSEFSVFVPVSLAHRARWLVKQLPLSEGELEYLATGKLSDEDH